MTRANLAVIVVSWNNKADVLRCLASIFAAQGDYWVIVVDNGSQDDTVEAIKRSYPQVMVLEHEENLGYTGGNNTGMRYALDGGADCVLLLNDDAVLAPDAISHLLAVAADHPEAGLLGPNIYALEEPTRFLSSGGIFACGWRPVHRGLGARDDARYSDVSEVDFVSGCALFATRELIERIGALDERFFAYHEDIDWCYRAKKAGYKLLVVPQARIWHPDTRNRDVDSASVTYYMARNRLLFMRKHRLGARLFLNTLGTYLLQVENWSLRPKWRHKRAQRNALVQAVLDYALGRFGRFRSSM